MLSRHGIDMRRVHVFVAPSSAPEQSRPEWSRYIRELRAQGYGEVHVEPGGDSLWGQMQAIFTWATAGTYLICLSDDVDDIQIRKVRKNETLHKKPLPHGSLEALFAHAWDVMCAGEFAAWGLNASKNVLSMDTNALSRKLGLLEGNFWGVIAEPYLATLLSDPEVSVIYDAAFTTELWASGRRFFRYRGLSAATAYKAPGGLMTSHTKLQRRQSEDQQIRKLSAKHASLVQFKPKEKASLNTMQFAFSTIGSGPIRLRDPTPVTGGRRYEGFATRKMTPAERQRKHRLGDAAFLLAMKRPASALSSR